jgi:hypothetical protein
MNNYHHITHIDHRTIDVSDLSPHRSDYPPEIKSLRDLETYLDLILFTEHDHEY